MIVRFMDLIGETLTVARPFGPDGPTAMRIRSPFSATWGRSGAALAATCGSQSAFPTCPVP